MKLKKLIVMGLTIVMTLGFSVNVSAEDNVVISILDYNTEGTLGDAMKEIQARYTELNPNVEFEYINMDSNDMLTTYVNRTYAGDAPDLYQGKPRTMQEFIEAGYLLELSEYDLLGDINPDIAEEMEVDGGYYGVPFDGQVKGVFYNKRMFEEAGVAVPVTFDEFIEVCDTFMAQDVYPFMVPLYGTSTIYHFIDVIVTPMAYVRDNNTIYEDAQNGTVPLAENENIIEAFEIFSKLMTYKASNDGNRQNQEAVQAFAIGERPMMITGGWSMSDVVAAAEAAETGDEFGFFPFPWSNNAEENLVWFGADDVFVISSQSEHVEECIDFAKFLSSGEGSEIWSERSLHFTARSDMEVDTTVPHLKDISGYISSGQSVSKSQVPDLSGEALNTYKTAIQQFASEGYTAEDISTVLQDVDNELAFIRGE